ncbi:hypothetical protein R70723_15915 [Paenibacillus sp. FSL R7-0273]|uniref:AraC family transcriptional regulator n=1 Tax=Paenibacillus sp. FSL R7-0273 TaxID=1536772 RepID=UPI0004F74685|nr:AraC family transcriptional regulator [Paenibacillus sp. FSL R7-0273]AIQ47205.1 hypothetical protein R70723_15915 [Paenibacillus sp. FSL R7-0273]OMF91524.1 hypothetical protein BK144_15120 [Paenibacillus sp. FSL R7-0273]
MNLKEHILLWTHAAVEIIDIRHNTYSHGEQALRYRLPCSAFICTVRGKAVMVMDGIRHELNEGAMLHGGKGTTFELAPPSELVEYYLILYRARLALPARKHLLSVMNRDNPFELQYICSPDAPLPLIEKLRLMHEHWLKGGRLEQLHVKSTLYQWVYELLRQLHAQQIQPLKPDVLGTAIRYMENNISLPLSLDKLAETAGSSPRSLSRLFRMRLHTSPNQYLISMRMEKARELLLRTEASLQDIAAAIGHPDAYYFGRMFKKHYGISPVRYKNSIKAAADWPEMTSGASGFDIVRTSSLGYSVDNHYQYKSEGASFMSKSARPSLLITLLLCFSIVLSACAAGNTNTASGSNTTSPSPSASAAPAATDTPSAEAQTRTITTVKGDIEVPADPQRVVVLYLLGDVLALGVKPVGVSDVSEGAAFEEELSDVQKLGTWFEASPEAILSLDPDLIIVPSDETYEVLKDIAPTVLVPYETMSAEERVAFIGEALGKEEQAKTLFDEFHAKVEEGKQKLQEAGILDRTVSIMEGGSKRSMAVVTSKQFGRGSQVIYEYLGMKAPAIIQEKVETSTEAVGEDVSFEVLADYSGDYMFRSSYEGMADLTQDPVWNSIPAVKAGRLINIDFGLSYYSDIYSLNAQLDYIVESLLAAPRVD